jgi:hypothetical protein
MRSSDGAVLFYEVYYINRNHDPHRAIPRLFHCPTFAADGFTLLHPFQIPSRVLQLF